jgi:hypothetical protein
LVPDGLDSLDDESHLFVVVVAIARCAEVAGGGDALPGRFIRQITADFRDEFFEGREEDRLFLFLEALEMSFGAFREKKASAACDLEAFVDELVLIGVSKEAQIDA